MEAVPQVHPEEDVCEQSPLDEDVSDTRIGIQVGPQGSDEDEQPLRGGEKQLWCGAR